MVPTAQLAREDVPELPESASISDLDKEIRAELRGLSKEFAERIGRHLVMAGRLLEADPELAYRHARAAADRASRIPIVRETAGLTAYVTGRYSEAARELRTYRRLSGSSEHLAIIADCERGLGHPEKAVELATGPEAQTLDAEEKIELAIVLAGARGDRGEHGAGLAVLAKAARATDTPELLARIEEARERLVALRDGGDPAELDAPVPIEEPEPAPSDISFFDVQEGAW
jgi:hypothetical protein